MNKPTIRQLEISENMKQIDGYFKRIPVYPADKNFLSLFPGLDPKGHISRLDARIEERSLCVKACASLRPKELQLQTAKLLSLPTVHKQELTQASILYRYCERLMDYKPAPILTDALRSLETIPCVMSCGKVLTAAEKLNQTPQGFGFSRDNPLLTIHFENPNHLEEFLYLTCDEVYKSNVPVPYSPEAVSGLSQAAQKLIKQQMDSYCHNYSQTTVNRLVKPLINTLKEEFPGQLPHNLFTIGGTAIPLTPAALKEEALPDDQNCLLASALIGGHEVLMHIPDQKKHMLSVSIKQEGFIRQKSQGKDPWSSFLTQNSPEHSKNM